MLEAAYDHRTRRVVKNAYARGWTGGAGITRTGYRHDGGVSFQDTAHDDTNHRIAAEHVRGSGLGGGIGSILHAYRDGGQNTPGSLATEYFAYGMSGDVTALTDAAGDTTGAQAYRAFGAMAGEWSLTGTPAANDRLANTKERDWSTGLDLHGFRYYDPSTGRYLSRDPIGYADGPNVYLHVGNDPANKIDPLGLSEDEGRGWHNLNPLGLIIVFPAQDLVHSLERGGHAQAEAKLRRKLEARVGNNGGLSDAYKSQIIQNSRQDGVRVAAALTAGVATNTPGVAASPVAVGGTSAVASRLSTTAASHMDEAAQAALSLVTLARSGSDDAAEAATGQVAFRGASRGRNNGQYVFRGDRNYRPGSPVGIPLAQASTAEIQTFYEHVLKKEGQTSRYTSFTTSTRVASRFAGPGGMRHVKKAHISELEKL